MNEGEFTHNAAVLDGLPVLRCASCGTVSVRRWGIWPCRKCGGEVDEVDVSGNRQHLKDRGLPTYELVLVTGRTVMHCLCCYCLTVDETCVVKRYCSFCKTKHSEGSMIREAAQARVFRDRLEAVGASTYVLGQVGDMKCIICLCCGTISYNNNDVEFLYCGHCHEKHEKRTALEASSQRQIELLSKVNAWQKWAWELDLAFKKNRLEFVGDFPDRWTKVPRFIEAKDLEALVSEEEVDAKLVKPPAHLIVQGLLTDGNTYLVFWNGTNWEMTHEPELKFDVVRWRRIKPWFQD